jgi:hypothetical protein
MSQPNRAYAGAPTLQPVCFRQNLALFLLVSTSAVPALNMTGFFQFWPMSMWLALPLSVLGGIMGGMLYAPPGTNCLLGVLPGMLAGPGGLLATFFYTYARETIYRFEGVLVWMLGVLPAGLLYFLLLKLCYPARRYQPTAQPNWPPAAMPGIPHNVATPEWVAVEAVPLDAEPLPAQANRFVEAPPTSHVGAMPARPINKRSLWLLWIGGGVVLGGLSLFLMVVAALLSRGAKPAARAQVRGLISSEVPVMAPATIQPTAQAKLSAEELEQLLAGLDAAQLHRVRAAADRLANAVPDDEQRERVGAALIGHLDHENLFTRRGITAALGVWGVEEQLGRLIEQLNDRDLTVRRAAMDALAARKYAAAAEPLASLLASPSDRSRASATLQLLGASAEPAVRMQLEHEDLWVRLEACRILSQIGTHESAEALRQAANDHSLLVKRAAEDALQAVARRSPP